MAKELELISLKDIIPGSIAGDKNVQAIVAASDPQQQEVSRSIREAFIVSRINELPENVIDLLAWQWHVDFYEPELPIDTKRKLVLESIRWHRKKGTKSAIISALEKLNFVPTIKEWFEPELKTKPHTFSVRGYYKDDHVNVDFLGPETEEILTRVIELTKPARSHLLKLVVAPIPIDMTKHICYWDVCNWEHAEFKQYRFILIPNNPVFVAEPVTGRDFERGILTVSDSSFWDFATWGSYPYRLLNIGSSFETVIFAALDDDYLTWMSPFHWDDFTWSDSGRVRCKFMSTIERDFQIVPDIYISDSPFMASGFFRGISSEQIPYVILPYGSLSETGFFAALNDKMQCESVNFSRSMYRGISAFLDWNMSQSSFTVSDFFRGIICDLRPYWDTRAWYEHSTWSEEPEQQPIASCVQTPLDVSLEYEPVPTWSSHKTWAGSDTWTHTAEQSGSCEFSRFIFEEAV